MSPWQRPCSDLTAMPTRPTSLALLGGMGSSAGLGPVFVGSAFPRSAGQHPPSSSPAPRPAWAPRQQVPLGEGASQAAFSTAQGFQEDMWKTSPYVVAATARRSACVPRPGAWAATRHSQATGHTWPPRGALHLTAEDALLASRLKPATATHPRLLADLAGPGLRSQLR